MKISVIIPVYNEESTIHAALEDLMTRHRPEEAIVVDGGSMDNTAALAKEWTKMIRTDKGRATQMNRGAEEASGDVFLFLHADTKLPEQGLVRIRRAIEGGAKGGRFRIRFDHRDWLLWLYESYTRFHFFSYGDQGFFVTRKMFEDLGGFNEKVPFEDIDFYKRLRQQTRPVIIKDPVTTSARRFCGVGCLRQKFINLFLVGLYYAGFDVLRMKEKLYSEVR